MHFSVNEWVTISLIPSRIGSARRGLGSYLDYWGTICEEIACMEWKVEDSLMKSFVDNFSCIIREKIRVYTSDPFLFTMKNA